MNTNSASNPKKTLLLTVDSCDHGLLLLPKAIRLAEKMQATLRIVLIEDQPLLKLAALPFTQEVSLYSSARHALDVTALKNAFVRQCDELRRQIDRQTEKSRLPWTLQTTEGRRTEVVLSLLQSADLIAISGTAVTTAPMRHAHSTHHANGGIFVSTSGATANVSHALALAHSLGNGSSHLQLIAATGQGLRITADTDIHLVDDDSIAALLAVVRSHHAELLILPLSHPALQKPADLLQLLESTPVPLMLVRG